MVNAQQWLDKNYPKKERKNVKEIFILNESFREKYYDVILFLSLNSSTKDRDCLVWLSESEKLEGSLDLDGFTNLEILTIRHQGITQLKMGGCLKLKKILCSDNQITNMDLSGLDQLEEIILSNNLLTDINFSSSNPTKLTKLHIDNNNFSAHDLSYFFIYW